MLSCLVQSVAFQTAETTPTTATQRTMAEEQVPAVPTIPEAEHLLGEQEESASATEEPPAEAK